MNNLRIAKIIVVFSSLSYLSVSFLRNYNSPENIEKRCIVKFEKDFKNNLETTHEEWDQILDLADKNYPFIILKVFLINNAKESKISKLTILIIKQF